MAHVEVGVGSAGGVAIIRCSDSKCEKIHDIGDHFVYVKCDGVMFLLAETIRCGEIEFDSARPFDGADRAKEASEEIWQSVLEKKSVSHLNLVRISDGPYLSLQ